MIDIGPLKVFSVVADVGSFSKAGLLLGVSQSAVSQAVALLEKHYGVTLLDRSDRRHIRLTPQGESLLSHARRILSESETLDYMFSHYDALTDVEELKIAVVPSLVEPAAGRLLAALFAVNPRLHVILCTPGDGVEADFYLLEDGAHATEDFNVHPLCAYLMNVVKHLQEPER